MYAIPALRELSRRTENSGPSSNAVSSRSLWTTWDTVSFFFKRQITSDKKLELEHKKSQFTFLFPHKPFREMPACRAKRVFLWIYCHVAVLWAWDEAVGEFPECTCSPPSTQRRSDRSCSQTCCFRWPSLDLMLLSSGRGMFNNTQQRTSQLLWWEMSREERHWDFKCACLKPSSLVLTAIC